MTDMIRLAITDDHQIVIEGLRHILEAEDRFEVVHSCSSGGGLIASLLQSPVDVVLLDIDMPGMNGIQVCKKLATDFPDIRVIGLSMLKEPSIIRKMLEAGAKGYLLKNTARDELFQCIDTVYDGRTYYAAEVAQSIMNDLSGVATETSTSFPRLSRREKEIIKLIADEMTTQEVADRLGIAFGTVETHRRNIMHKLGARNVVGMVRIALENGLLED